MGLLSVVKSVPNGLQFTPPNTLLETNILREGTMILFLGLRAEESEELYHRNPVFEGARGYAMQAQAPNDERNCDVMLWTASS